MRKVLVVIFGLLAIAAAAALSARDGAPLPVTPPKGLSIRLSDAIPVPDEPRPSPVVTPLSSDDLQRLLARLPPIATQPDDAKDFARPIPPVARPRSGRTVLAPFPPPMQATRPDVADAGPLRVVRRSPEGEAGDAPAITIVFSQPMTPLATVGRVAESHVPARLTPSAPGRWRWLDTRTLRFEPQDGRAMPLATQFDVEVPAGTRSELGATLAEAERWTFSTRRPAINFWWTDSTPIGLSPIFAVMFDQRVDPARVIEHVSIRAAGNAFDVQAVDPATVEGETGDDLREWMEEQRVRGRVVVFRAARELPYDSKVVVTIAAGTPSAEGPLGTAKDEVIEFATYGPLRVIGQQCGWNGPCSPGHPWTITLSNPLDEASFDPSRVTVSPRIADFQVELYDSNISITGSSQPNTHYVVSLPATLRDSFGQTLGRATRVAFDVGRGSRTLEAPANPLLVIPPSSRPTLPVLTAGLQSIRVRLWSVSPDDWPAVGELVSAARARPDQHFDYPGRTPIERHVRIASDADQRVQTSVDLSEALRGQTGHVLVAIEAEGVDVPRQDELMLDRLTPTLTWIQVTNIGLDALVDGRRLLAWASDLSPRARRCRESRSASILRASPPRRTRAASHRSNSRPR